MTKKQAVCSGIITILFLSGWGTSKEQNISGDKKHSKNFYGTLETWENPAFPVDNISINDLISKISLFVKPVTQKTKKDTSAQIAAAAAQAAEAAKEAAAAAKQASKSAKKAIRGEKKAVEKTAEEAAKAAQAAADAAAAAAKAITATAPQKTTPTKHVLERDPKSSLIEFELDLVEVDKIKTPHPDEIWLWQKDKGYRKQEFVEIEVISKGTPKTKAHYLIEKDKKIFCDKIDPAGPGEQKVPITALKNLKIEGYKDRDLEERKRKQAEEREKIKRLAEKSK